MRISDWSSDVCSSDLREFTVLSQTDLQTPEQFNNIVLRESQGYLVRLRDVGKAEIAAEDERRVTRFNDKTSIILGIIKTIGRASCRERVCQYVSVSVVAVLLKKTKKNKTKRNY